MTGTGIAQGAGDESPTNEAPGSHPRLRRLVLVASALFSVVWLATHAGAIVAEDAGLVRLGLGIVLFLAILARPGDPHPDPAVPPASRRSSGLAVLGLLLHLGGLVFSVRQFEWLGLIALLYAAWTWAMPVALRPNVTPALFILYWVHTLPWQVFSRLQAGMQFLSIQGSEWLLHLVNVRCWAEGAVLHLGSVSAGVPESCSGAVTLVTVLLAAAGVGLLFRFHPRQHAVLLSVAVFQTVAANILRIALTAWAARHFPPEWATAFLHDTLGVFLLGVVLLTGIEGAWMARRAQARTRRRDGIARGELEPSTHASPLPVHWQFVRRWAWPVLFLALLVAAGAWGILKRRPAHRAAMIADTGESMLVRDPPAAERAFHAAIALAPWRRDFLTAVLRARVLRGDSAAALAWADRIPAPLAPHEALLKAQALLQTGDLTASRALLTSLPASYADHPAFAMLRAEHAALQGTTTSIERDIKIARRDRQNNARIRRLYPFLAGRELWQAIAENDPATPYESSRTAGLAIYALLKVGRYSDAATRLQRARARWPEDPGLLNHLFVLAEAQPGHAWEEQFVEGARRMRATLTTDMAALLAEYCMDLRRPDVAMLLFHRLRHIDPRDPALLLARTRPSADWLTFRARALGLTAAMPAETVNLLPIMLRLQHWSPVRTLLAATPFDLMAPRRDMGPGQFSEALAELERREKSQPLSLRLELLYPSVLAKAGQKDRAHRRLESLATRYPDLRPIVLLQQATLHDNSAEFEQSYERLGEYFALSPAPSARAHLLLLNACVNLNFGVLAMEIADRIGTRFPHLVDGPLARAAVVDVYGLAAEALHALLQSPGGASHPSLPMLLHKTGRTVRAREVARAAGLMPPQADTPAPVQPLLPPAELACRPWPAESVSNQVPPEVRRRIAAESRSPFVRSLYATLDAWYASPTGSRSSVDWIAAGRTTDERAVALHRLALLQAANNETDSARSTLESASALLPRSPVLHRMLVALTGGAPDVIAKARHALPLDPELWLADLVASVERDCGPDTVKALLLQAAPSNAPPETLFRAADFLLRKGYPAPAAEAARRAEAGAEGLEAGYRIAFRCAAAQGDRDWGLRIAKTAIEHVADPLPYYKALVVLKSATGQADRELLSALEWLTKTRPAESEWRERLGQAHFSRGEPERALTVLRPLLDRERPDVQLQSLLVAAEAARLTGKERDSLALLQTADTMFPRRATVLNNMVYQLAQAPDTLASARSLLPELLKIAPEHYAVLDTAALVSFRAGDLASARTYAEKALAVLVPGSYLAAEVRLNAAEIQNASGNADAARALVDQVLSDAQAPAAVTARGRALRQALSTP